MVSSATSVTQSAHDIYHVGSWTWSSCYYCCCCNERVWATRSVFLLSECRNCTSILGALALHIILDAFCPANTYHYGSSGYEKICNFDLLPGAWWWWSRVRLSLLWEYTHTHVFIASYRYEEHVTHLFAVCYLCKDPRPAEYVPCTAVLTKQLSSRRAINNCVSWPLVLLALQC